ncbi:hypothetical protein J1N35_025309, partial [Gossypium stocksii]
LQGKTFIQERGFKPLTVLYKEIWALVWYQRWEYIFITPKDLAMILVVQEFCASFRGQDSRKPYDAIWEIVTVRGKE